MSTTSKNLSKEPPRSPRTRLGGYAILARMIDKGRATLAGTVGDYHYACPLDQGLLGFKGIDPEDVKKLLASGGTDEQVVEWFNTHGTPKTAEEIKAWSDGAESFSIYSVPEKREWFSGECTKLGLNPEVTSTFSWLEADDAASFKK